MAITPIIIITAIILITIGLRFIVYINSRYFFSFKIKIAINIKCKLHKLLIYIS